MKVKKLFALALAAVTALSITACKPAETSSAASGSGAQPSKEVVNLKWVMVGNGMPTNYDAWKANINKYLEEKIGVNIDVEVVAWGDWQSRRSVIVNTVGDYDILFTDMGTYASDVRLNAFADITNTVQSAASELYKEIPADYWEACKIDGKIYAVPTYKDSSATQYFVWDKELLDKYKLDVSKLHTLDSLTDALTTIKNGENTAPFILASDGLGALTGWYDRMGTGMPAIGVRYDDNNRKVVAVFEQEDVMNDLKTLNQWYKAGLINQDAATLAEAPKYRACFVAQGWSGAATTTWGPNMGKEAVAYQWGDTVASNDTVQGSLNCISSNCKNPDKALAFLQLVNTDSKVRDAFYYGLEGDNFTYTSDNRVHRNNTEWSMAGYTQGTFFNVTQLDDVDFNQWDEVKTLNENAKASVLLGFTFDPTDYADQIANCTAIFERYKGELLTGTADPETTVAAMMKEMRAAGFDDLLAAAQEQINNHFKAD
ncbi:MAG: ABC transporter substrate-binding protein [Acutalibacteraceae bacterium]|jgi:putative aldouronate transport system substrate-binding protein